MSQNTEPYLLVQPWVMSTYWYSHGWWVLTGTAMGDGYLLVQPWVMGTYWYSHGWWVLTGTSMANVVFLCWKDQGFAVWQVQCLPDSLLLLEYNVCHSVVHLKQSTSHWGPSETQYIALWSIWNTVHHSVVHLKQMCITVVHLKQCTSLCGPSETMHITLWSIWNTMYITLWFIWNTICITPWSIWNTMYIPLWSIWNTIYITLWSIWNTMYITLWPIWNTMYITLWSIWNTMYITLWSIWNKYASLYGPTNYQDLNGNQASLLTGDYLREQVLPQALFLWFSPAGLGVEIHLLYLATAAECTLKTSLQQIKATAQAQAIKSELQIEIGVKV